MVILRIAAVWLIALSLASLVFGGGEEFLYAFLLFGLLLTIPAVVILAMTSAVEGVFVRQGHRAVAVALGPAVGLIVSALLFLRAANMDKVVSDLWPVALIAFGTGLLWAASYLLFSRSSRLLPSEGQSD